jgi:hypothetical protein
MRRSWLPTLLLALVMAAGCRSSTTSGSRPPPRPPPPSDGFADIFEECVYDEDCYYFPDDLCYDVTGDFTAGMCTYECFDDFDCPEFSVCENIDGPWICYEECLDDFDCAPGFGCFYDFEGDVDVCLPI